MTVAPRWTVGLGTAPLGGLYEPVSPQTARDTVDAAWALGVRFFDTAPLYGSGLAEERLGQALAGRPRSEYTISTKVGRVLRPGRASPQFRGAPPLEPIFDYSPDGIRRSLLGSLERLQLDAVDIALLHDPEDHMDEARRAIETVRELAPRVGVGTNLVQTALDVVECGEIDVVLLAGRYTLLDRSAAAELLPLCADRGIELVAAGVFNSGILAGGSTFDYRAAPPAILERRRALEATCARYGVLLAAAAIQFPLRHPAVTSVVVGARTPRGDRAGHAAAAAPDPRRALARAGPDAVVANSKVVLPRRHSRRLRPAGADPRADECSGGTRPYGSRLDAAATTLDSGLVVDLGKGRRRQAEVFLSGVRGRRPAVPVDAVQLEARARQALPPEAFAYFAGGAGLESTIRANREAFERRRIVPRVLHGASTRDTSIELFGRRLPTPFLLAPIGVLELARPRGDLLVARAAAAEGVPLIFSSQASVSMEECAAAMGAGPRWFQLYWGASDDLAASFVRRAEACGCDAIVLTLDTTMLGWRPRDLDLAYLPFLHGKGIAQYSSDPVFQRLIDDAPPARAAGRPTLSAVRALIQIKRAYPGSFWSNLVSARPRTAVRLFLESFPRPALSWDDVARLRSLTHLPLLLKGILDPTDAHTAIEHGIDGIVVSNHGGRQLDGAVASLDALPRVVEAVAGRVPLLLDSGVRGGADIFKAIALGAHAVLIGRPYVYALALAGEEGVRETIENLSADFELTLALAGCVSVAEVGPQSLAPAE